MMPSLWAMTSNFISKSNNFYFPENIGFLENDYSLFSFYNELMQNPQDYDRWRLNLAANLLFKSCR